MPMFAWALVMMVASFAIQALLVKMPPPQGPAALGDFDFPQAEENTPHAVFFGDCWTEGWMVLWYGNYRSTKILSAGKK